MYFTIKKTAAWVLLLSFQIAILCVQASSESDYQLQQFDWLNILVLVDAAKSKVDSWCEYLFCGG